MNSSPSPCNPWPYAVVGVLALFAAGLASLVILAVRQPSQLVSQDYYEQELRYQQQIDRRTRAELLSTRARVEVDQVGRQLRIMLPEEHVHQGLTGRIRFYRPSDVRLDRALPLAPDPHGRQSLDLNSLPPGLWRVRIEWSSGGHDYALSERVDLGKAATESRSR